MTEEPELTEPVDLCDAAGRLLPAARGWSRTPLHRANLRGPWGRRKRWDYWCVITPEVIASITYADVDYLGVASVWVLDRATGATGSAGTMRPLGRGMALPELPCTGTMRALGRRYDIELHEAVGHTRLRASGGHPGSEHAVSVDVLVDRPAGHETMSVVVPWSDRRFQYTSKHTARPATGTIRLGSRTWTFGRGGDAWGVLDLGRGIWRYSNRWNWAAAQGRSETGAVIGLQFGGKWTDGTGATENALCVDGRLSKLGETLVWDYSWDDPMSPWHVRTPDSDQVDVVLTPTYDRHDRTSLGVLSMEVHQCFGTWSGTIRDDDGTRHELGGIHGFAEEARNRW